jgi:hypothetical protein
MVFPFKKRWAAKRAKELHLLRYHTDIETVVEIPTILIVELRSLLRYFLKKDASENVAIVQHSPRAF